MITPVRSEMFVSTPYNRLYPFEDRSRYFFHRRGMYIFVVTFNRRANLWTSVANGDYV